MNKTRIETTFKGVMTYSSDVYVADYTEQSRQCGLKLTEPERARLKTGIHIQDTEFSDINSFHIYNQNGVPFMAVNFEENKNFFPSGVKDCECMFRAKGVRHGWILLCEMKYCIDRAKNILDNGIKAIQQLEDTWHLLSSFRPALFDAKHCHTFLNISFPNGNTSVPFNAFQLSQDFLLDTRRKSRVTLLGVNDILIISNGVLKVAAPEI